MPTTVPRTVSIHASGNGKDREGNGKGECRDLWVYRIMERIHETQNLLEGEYSL
jgi:hypothetical protein